MKLVPIRPPRRRLRLAKPNDATELSGLRIEPLEPRITPSTLLASASSSSVIGNAASQNAVFSSDGNFVAFESAASNLITGDTNALTDIFIKNLNTNTITRVSTTSAGGETNGAGNNSLHPTINATGSFVAFVSDDNGLNNGDSNNATNVFEKDVSSGNLFVVNSSSTGAKAQSNSVSDHPSVSADGRYVVFHTNATNLLTGMPNNQNDILRKDTQTGAVVGADKTSGGVFGNSNSFNPTISADGRYVVFESDATNLVAGDTNGLRDVFIKDLQTGAITRVDTDSTGAQATGGASSFATLSNDARYVVFQSTANNLVSGDTNGVSDVFRKDLTTGAIVRASTDSSAVQSNGSSTQASVNSDGRYVAFQSSANNLVSGDTNGFNDVFVKDLTTGATYRASASDTGAQSNGISGTDAVTTLSIRGDGQRVVYNSVGTNLVTGDTNGVSDVFVSGYQPAIAFTENSGTANDDTLVFGNVQVGNSLSQTFTLTNTGANTLDVSQLNSSDGQYTFTPVNGAGSGDDYLVAPGGSQVVTVTFAPTVGGTDNASLTVFSNASNDPSHVINLTGAGVNQTVSVTESSGAPNDNALVFGNVRVGQTGSQTFTITNTGTFGTLDVSQLASSDSHYTFSPVNGSGSGDDYLLAPGNSQLVNVTFAPTAQGAVAGTITVSNNSFNSPSVTMNLSGTGVASIISVTESSGTPNDNALAFGNVRIGQTGAQTFTITNTGTTTLDVSQLNSADSHYTFTPVNGAGSGDDYLIAPSSSQLVTVTFAPTAQGAVNSTITVSSDALNSPSITLNLGGTGVAPVIQITESSGTPNDNALAFGSIGAGSSTTQTFTITNTGTANLDVSQLTSSLSQYTFTPVNGAGSGDDYVLAPSASQVVTVTFAPNTGGTFNGTLTINSDALGSPSTVVNLGGTGVAPGITVTESSGTPNDNALAFGNVRLGQSASQTFTITSSGTQTLNVTQLTSGDSHFTFTPANGAGSGDDYNLAPSNSQLVTVTFTPTAAGTLPTTLNVNSNAFGFPVTTLNLSGTGVNPTITVTESSGTPNDNTLAFGNVRIGQTGSQTFTITNTGTSGNLDVSQLVSSDSHYTFGPANGAGSGDDYILGPGASQLVTATFTPNAMGAQAGAITVTNDSLNAPSVTVNMNATGVAPNIAVTESSGTPNDNALVFGNVRVGQTGMQTMVITNNGTASMDVSQLSSSDSHYTIAPVNGAGSGDDYILAPSGSQIVLVTFTPTAQGAVGSTLTISSDAFNNPSYTVSLNGTGVAPTIQITESSGTSNDNALVFGNVNVGNSFSQTFTVTNTGTANLDVSQLSSSNARYTFTPVNGAGSGDDYILAPSASQLVTVTFTPTAAGSVPATLTVTSDALNTPSVPLSLSGTGIAPNIQVTENSGTANDNNLDFGSVRLGQSSSQTFTITNNGTATLDVSQLTAGNGQYTFAPFNGSGSGDDYLLAPTASQLVTVTYTPTSAGSTPSTLAVASNALNAPTVTLNLAGTGLNPTLTVTESSGTPNDNALDFGNVRVGQTVNRTFTLTNTGSSGSLDVSELVSSDSHYTFTPVNGGGSGDDYLLAPSASQMVTVTFAPDAMGGVPGSITVTNDSLNAPSVTISLAGTGVAPIAGTTESSGAPDDNVLEFGDIRVGQTGSQQFSITNTGTANLDVSQLVSSDSHFTFTPVNGGGSGDDYIVAPSGSQLVTVTFAPTALGVLPGTMTVSSDGFQTEMIQLSLTGTGVGSVISITESSGSVNDNALGFGNVNVGSSNSQTFTITNTGTDVLNVSLATTSNGQYSINPPNGVGSFDNYVLNPSDSQTITVDYSPTVMGAAPATLTLTSDAMNGPTSTLSLSGAGVAPVISITESSGTVNDNALAFGNVRIGQSVTQNFTITNSGTAPLDVAELTSSDGHFTLSPVNNPGSGDDYILAPSASQVVAVTFTPDALGSLPGTLAVSSNAFNTPLATLTMGGTGVASMITVTENSGTPNDDSLEYGMVNIGSSATRTFTITNTGTASLRVSEIASDDAHYTVTPANGSGTGDDYIIAPSASRVVTVSFSPGDLGDLPASLTITSDALNTPSYSVNVDGEGSVIVLAGSDFGYYEEDGDRVVISLTGPGTATVLFSTLIGNPNVGSVDDIILAGTTTGSTLSIRVISAPGSDRMADIGEIEGSNALGGINAPTSIIGEAGLHIGGLLRSMNIANVLDNSVIEIGGTATDHSNVAMGMVGFNVAFTSGATLDSMTMRGYEGGEISAPNIGTLTCIGTFGPNILVAGNLSNLSVVASDVPGDISVGGNAGNIFLGGQLLGELNVNGNLTLFRSLNLGNSVHVGGYMANFQTGQVEDGLEITAGGTVSQLTNIKLGNVLGELHVAVGSTLNTLVTGSWEAGLIEAPGIKAFTGRGDFGADMEIDGNVDAFNVQGGAVSGAIHVTGSVKNFSLTNINSFAHAGPFAGTLNVDGNLLKFSALDVAGNINVGGALGALSVRDILDGADISAGGVPAKRTTIAARDISGETDITVGSTITTLTVHSWDDGSLTSPLIGRITSAGHFGADVEVAGAVTNATVADGDITGTWHLGSKLGQLNMIRGTYSGAIFANAIDKFVVPRMADGIVAIHGPIKSLNVNGDMLDSTISGFSGGAITVKGIMENSAVLFGIDLGADGLIGGGDDDVTYGTLTNMLVTGDVINSIIGAGFDPIGLTTPNPSASVLKTITVNGDVDEDSFIGSGRVLSAKIRGVKIDPLTDPRFIIG